MRNDYRIPSTSRPSSSLEVRIPYVIPPSKLDADAVDIVRRLVRYGHQAFLVGGCIRDIHQGLPPKDYDIVTSARPNQIKKLFRNCRVIGRRFRLAHIHVAGKIIEVATFRGMEQDGEQLGGRHGPTADNVFGTAEEDAMRRDFTINGLYYDVDSHEIVDYVGGFSDLRRRLIRCIGDPEIRMHEDPVRMIRALKLAAKVEFRLDPPLEDAIRRERRLIRESSPARILEELFKILGSGAARRTIRLLHEYRLLENLLPEVARGVPPDQTDAPIDRFLDALDVADQGLRIHSNPVLLAALFLPVLDPRGEALGLAGGPATPAAGQWHDADDLEDVDVDEAEEDERWGREPRQPMSHLRLTIMVSRLVRNSPILRNLPRRDLHQLGQILVLQRRIATTPPRAAGRLVRKDSFPDALRLFMIACTALRVQPDTLDAWRAHLERLPRARRDEDGDWGPRPHDDVDELDFDQEFDEQEHDGEMAELDATLFPRAPRRRRGRRRRRD